MTSSPPLEVFGVGQDREEVQLGGDEVPLGQVVNFDQMCAAVIATDVAGFEPGAAQDARAVVEQEATPWIRSSLPPISCWIVCCGVSC